MVIMSVPHLETPHVTSSPLTSSPEWGSLRLWTYHLGENDYRFDVVQI